MPLSNKEIFFESVLAQLPGDIAVFNMQHQYIYVNPQAIKSPEIRKWIIGKTDFEYCEYRNIDSLIATKRYELFNKVVASKQELELEEVITDKSGEVRYYLRRLTPVFSDFGEISFVIGYGIEITERKKMRIELDTRSSFIDKVLNTSPHLIYVKDAEGRFQLANQAMANLFNTDIESLINISNEEVHTTKTETDAYSIIDQKVLSSLKPVNLIEPFTKQDGTKIWFDTIKVPLIDSNGVVKVLGISTDITEKWLVAEKQRENNLRLIAGEEITKSGNWEINYESQEIYWSPGMYVIWERDEELGLPTIDESYLVMHPEDAVKLKTGIAEIKVSGMEFRMELRLLLPSGIKFLDSITKPKFNEEGKVLKLFGAVRDITEEINIKNLLKENEYRLNEIQELASMGSFSYNILNGEILWSPPVFKIFKRDPTLGVPAFDEFLKYVHNDDKDSLLKMMEVLSYKVEPYEYNYRIVCDDGEVKHLKILNKPIFDDNNKCVKIVGSIADVTERIQIEKTLLQKEQRLLEAQDLAKSGSWEYDLKRGINIWSAGHYKLWDLDESQPVPSFAEFLLTVHAEYRPRMEEFMKEALSSGKENSIEYKITTNSGVSKVMFSRAVVELDVANMPIRVYGYVLDITERRRNEEKLQLSEQRLLEAQELAHFGSWQMDLLTKEVKWSTGTYKIFEIDTEAKPYSLEELSNNIYEEDRIVFNTAINDAIIKDKSIDIEFRICLSKNRIKYLEGKGKSGRDKNNNAISLYGTVLDITDRKKFEYDLVQANKQADESVKAQEYFLANVTHELRTPINGVIGMARLLNKTDLSTTQRNYLDILSKTADNLLLIINDILDTAKIESGNLSFEKIVFDPSRVADTVVQTQLYKAEEKDLFIRHIVGMSSLPHVIGDPFRLNQILLNLLSNAIKFTQQGEVLLTHRVVEEQGENVIIEFSIKDTGIGIAANELEKIFERFTQIEGYKSTSKEGTGLGLTISKNLVEMQGGKIWVKSELGKGSIFAFSISYKKALSVPKAKVIERISPGDFGNMRILLAEDNRVNQFITEAMLQDWGFKIDVASNGKEAVALLERNNYDIILMDIQMPEMNGVEATKIIRAMEDRVKSKIPIIALTANTTRQSHKKFLAEGMTDCLVKPFQEETLYKKIFIQLKAGGKINQVLKRPRFPLRKLPELSVENLYNLSLLKSDTRNNHEFLIKMLGIFIDTIPSIIIKMHSHFDNNEMDAISTLAHKIKPTLHSAGILSLRDVIRNIEEYRDRKRTPEQLKNDLTKLKEVINEVTVAFQKEIIQLKESIE